MNELKSIQSQLECMVLTLSHRVQDIYASLIELQNLTDILLDITQNDPKAITNWLVEEEFEKSEHNYFKSKKKLKQFHNNQLPKDAVIYQWPTLLKNNSELQFTFYAFRNIGSVLQNIKERLGGVSLIYYQDIKFSVSLCFPYFDIASAIPADFNWLEYHSVRSVNPENNPAHKIQWTPPNIDYADDGLISIASIPIYKNDEFIGVWSIDVPLITIYQDCILDTFIPGQVNFITDFQGTIVNHPTIKTKIDKDKGSFYQIHIKDLGKGFENLNFNTLIKSEKGIVEVTDEQGDTSYVIYQIIPNIEWILFSTFSKEVTYHSVGKEITKIFEDIKKKTQPNTINVEVESEIKVLVSTYNDMIEVLDYNQKEREKSQEKIIKAQHDLNEKLEATVQLRTEELQRLNSKLKYLANIDPLTGLNNRRSFIELIKPSLKLSVRGNKSSSLLMLDIDLFKAINDKYGHDVGDAILKNFSQVMLDSIRESDICSRHGGEEFLVFLPNTNINSALILSEKLREIFEKNRFKGIRYTVSIGVTEFYGKDIKKAIKRADIALYSAKNNGRNKVECLSSNDKT